MWLLYYFEVALQSPSRSDVLVLRELSSLVAFSLNGDRSAFCLDRGIRIFCCLLFFDGFCLLYEGVDKRHCPAFQAQIAERFSSTCDSDSSFSVANRQ